MDILHLVDRLEEAFNAGRPVPLTRYIMVDEDRILEIIDQMRVSIPEEVKKAQQVLAQHDRIVAQAHEESERTLQLAKEKTDQMITREALVIAAQGRAEQIIQTAQADAETIRTEADDYALETLNKLEADLARSLTQIRNGITKLASEKTDKSGPSAAPTSA